MRKPRHRDIPAARALSMALMPEVRQVQASNLEVRSASGDSEIIVTGCPCSYNDFYTVHDRYGSFEERLLPGSMADVLEEDIVFLFNHLDDEIPLARTTSGTMTLDDRADGLYFEARLDPRQERARSLAVAIERGDVSQMSITMGVDKQNGQSWNDDMTKRTITRLKRLSDISAVTWPCNTFTSLEIAKRSLLQAPVESTVRLMEMATEIRAGKVLSAATQTKLVDAFSSMYDVLGKSGYNFSDLFHDEEELDTENPTGEITAVEVDPVSDDGSVETAETAETVDADARSLDLARAELELLLLRRH